MSTPEASSLPSDADPAGTSRVPLGTLLLRTGLVSAEQLLEALEDAGRTRKRLGEIIVERGWVSDRDLARLLAEQSGLGAVELDPRDVDPAASRSLSPEDSTRLGAVVIGFDDGVPVVAVSDPSNVGVLENIRSLLGADARFVVATRSDVSSVLATLASGADEPASAPTPQAYPSPSAEVARTEALPAEAASMGEAVDTAQVPEQAVPSWPPRPEPDSIVSPDGGFDVVETAAEPSWPPHAATGSSEEAGDVRARDVAEPREAFGEPGEISPPAEVEGVPQRDETPHQDSGAASASPYEFAPWPEAVAVRSEEVVQFHDAAANGNELSTVAHEAEAPARRAADAAQEPEPAFAQEPEPAFAQESEPAFEQEAALDGPHSTEPMVIVITLNTGDELELGSFGNADEAHRRATELVHQLIAEEANGWPFIEGRYFRPGTIASVGVARAAG
jgi:hypothetical protein